MQEFIGSMFCQASRGGVVALPHIHHPVVSPAAWTEGFSDSSII